MSELRTHRLRHNTATGDPNIEMYADGSTSIRNLQNFAKSLVVNGAMAVNQRGDQTGLNASGVHSVDRMRVSIAQNDTLEFSSTQEDDAPAGFANSYQLEVTTVQANDDDFRLTPLEYRIEGQDCQHLDWGTANAKSLSVSFWVKCSLAGDYSMSLFLNETQNRNISTTFTIASGEADDWKLITHTFPGDTATTITNDSTNRLRLYINGGCGVDWATTDSTAWGNYAVGRFAFGQTAAMHTTLNSTMQVTGLQITPTDNPIEFQHESIGETLAKCQRYCRVYRFTNSGSAGTLVHRVVNASGSVGNESAWECHLGIEGSMRIDMPTVSFGGDTTGFTLRIRSGATTGSNPGLTCSRFSKGIFRITTDTDTDPSDITQIRGNSTDGELLLTAEL